MHNNHKKRDYETLLNQANIFFESGDLNKALEKYRKATKLRETYEVAFQIGFIYLKLGNYQSAIFFLEKAIEINPLGLEAPINLAAIFNNIGEFEKSISTLSNITNLYNSSKEAWLNMGVAYASLSNFEAANSCYDQAIKIDPNYLEAISNKGNSEYSLQNFREAKVLFDKALMLSPNDPDTLSNYSVLKLAEGDFETGLLYYESRFVCKEKILNPFLDIPKLLSIEKIRDKKLLIWSEQGLGDTIQFCRYLEPLYLLAKQVTLVVQDELIELISENFHQIRVVNFKEVDKKKFDYQCPLMSLPLIFETTVNSIPAKIPYLNPNKQKAEFWASELKEYQGIKVGIVWKGGKKINPSLFGMNERRNIDLNQLKDILNIDGLSFFLLQKEIDVEDLDLINKLKIESKLFNYSEKFVNFSDTAAFISNLNVILSVDTSVAHLAGAMGKKTLLLNRYDSCWRWMQNRSDSPWYPTMLIFRQSKFNEWSNALSQVEVYLKNMVTSRVIDT